MFWKQKVLVHKRAAAVLLRIVSEQTTYLREMAREARRKFLYEKSGLYENFAIVQAHNRSISDARPTFKSEPPKQLFDATPF